jgi:four helix bundle protein
MTIRDFKELNVYRTAFDAAFSVFEMSKRFPRDERYSLTDQVRRSSRSICANIAEAWRKRRYPASFVSKLSDADAEAAETQVWLDIALRCGYIDATAHDELADRYDHICAQLVKMMADAERWCGVPAGQRSSH